jgi:predicted  nucleic acid-binding Zn-ribbon protein
VIALRTNEALLGFFIFRIERLEAFAPYEPFLHNLANYIALSLEGRMQRRLLEETRDELEAKNRELEELNRCFVGRELRMLELKEKIASLEGATREAGSAMVDRKT